MSTSPSWFDQDKFSRLVKKVGNKTVTNQQAAVAPPPAENKPAAEPAAKETQAPKAPIKPLLKEATLPEGEEAPKAPAKPFLKEATLPEGEEVSKPPALPPLKKTESRETPKPPAKPLLKEATLPEGEEVSKPAPMSLLKEAELPAEEETPQEEDPKEAAEPVSKAPPLKPSAVEKAKAPPFTQPPKETQRLPKIEPASEEPELVPAEGAADLPKEIEEEAPPLPSKVNAQKMMTSQSLVPIKKNPTLALRAEPKMEPIRAPEATTSTAKAPPVPEPAPGGLPRRTAPLPALKSLFQYEIPASKPKPADESAASKNPLPSFSSPKPEAKVPEIPPPVPDEEEEIPTFSEVEDSAEESVKEPEFDSELTTESLAADWGNADKLKEDIEKLTRERDDALAESESLRKQVEELQGGSAPAENSEELVSLTRERDQIRSEYIRLRQDFEALKDKDGPKTGSTTKRILNPKAGAGAESAANPELEKEIEKLRGELDEKNKELAQVEEQLAERQRELQAVKSSTSGMDEISDKLKKELADAQAELKKAKDEASMAQRGLALSQKALQETREALREAQEGGGQKSSFGTLK